MRALRVVAGVAAVLGALLGLGALWWWAIAGMSPEIATASGCTAFALLAFGAAAGTFPE